MSVYADTHDAIHEAVQAFAAAQSIACAYPNAKFTPPRTAAGRDLAWMRLAFIDGSIATEVILTAPSPVYRAAFVLSFFAPHDSGTASLTELVQAAVDYFPEGDDFGPAIIERAATSSAPSVDGWSQINVTFYFRAE